MILEIDSITLKRSNKVLFTNFSLNVNKSQIIIFTGDNGVGKSSLLEAISGVLKVHKGKIKKSENAQNVFYIGHENCLKEDLSVFDNLKIWCDTSRLKVDSKKIFEGLKSFNMTELTYQSVKKLSQGQKRRVALTKLFFTNSPLILLDEPLSGLDLKSENNFLKIIDKKRELGKTIILSSHNHLKLKDQILINLNNYTSNIKPTNKHDSWDSL